MTSAVCFVTFLMALTLSLTSGQQYNLDQAKLAQRYDLIHAIVSRGIPSHGASHGHKIGAGMSDRQTGRQTDRQRGRQTELQACRQAGRQQAGSRQAAWQTKR